MFQIFARPSRDIFTKPSGKIVARAVPEPFIYKFSSFLKDVFPPPAKTYLASPPYLCEISAITSSPIFFSSPKRNFLVFKYCSLSIANALPSGFFFLIALSIMFLGVSSGSISSTALTSYPSDSSLRSLSASVAASQSFCLNIECSVINERGAQFILWLSS